MTVKTTLNNRSLLRIVTLIITVFALVVSTFSMFSLTASAENSDSSKFTYSDIQWRIRWLRDCQYEPFKAGSVWYGSYKSEYTAVYDTNGARYWGWQTTDSTLCQGFGRLAFDALFMDKATTATRIVYKGSDKISDKIAWLKSNLRPGDYLSYGGHVLIFYDMDDKRVYAYDNNHGKDYDHFDRTTYFETFGWDSYTYCNQGGDTIKNQLKKNPDFEIAIVRTDAEVIDDRNTNNSNNNIQTAKSYTAYITGTDGSLVINSKPSKGYGIAEMPEYSACTVYPDKSVGNWYYVSDGVHEGYSYGKYLTTTEPSYSWGCIHDTDGSLCINRTPSVKYCIAEIPEGTWCKVYSQRRRGNWVWVCYNGVYGWSYRTYIRY